MSDPHRIRLHGPWHVAGVQTTNRSVGESPTKFSFRAKVPFSAGELNQQWKSVAHLPEADPARLPSAFKLTRRFQWPHGQQPGRSVELCWRWIGQGPSFSVYLNDALLTPQSGLDVDAQSDGIVIGVGEIESMLQPSNQLRFELTGSAFSTLQVVSVWLDVREVC